MTRPGLRIISLREASAKPPPPIEAHEAVVGKLVACAVLTVVGAAIVALPHMARGEVPFIGWLGAYWVGGLALLVGLLVYGRIRAALTPNAWVLRAGPEEILVNLRSYLNRGLSEDDPVVAVIPRRAVRGLRGRLDKGLRPHWRQRGYREEHRVEYLYLDILLAGTSTDAVRAALAAEEPRMVRRLGIGYRSRHRPVQVVGEDALRIVWRGRMENLRPKPHEAVERLGQWYRILPQEVREDAPLDELTPEEREERLVSLVERGETLAAAALARELHGLGLTEAKQYVDRLRK